MKPNGPVKDFFVNIGQNAYATAITKLSYSMACFRVIALCLVLATPLYGLEVLESLEGLATLVSHILFMIDKLLGRGCYIPM